MTTHAIHMQEPWNLSESLSSFSDWHRARKAVALCLSFKQRLRQLVNSKKTQPSKTVKRPRESYTPILTVEEIKSAEKEIFKAVQAMAFHEDISTLKKDPLQDRRRRKLPIILHVIKLFRIHLKALVKIVYYILKGRKKDVHLLKFTKPPIM